MIRSAAIRTGAVGLAIAVTLTLAASAEAAASVIVRPNQGPPGTAVRIHGTGWAGGNPCGGVSLSFVDARGATYPLGSATPDPDGSFRLRTQIPSAVALGRGSVVAAQVMIDHVTHRCRFTLSAHTSFRVTS